MITSFEAAGLGSASTELRVLGGDFILDVLEFCQKVHDGTIDHLTMQPFTVYRGIEMFLVSSANKFAILAVEVDSAGGLDVIVMFVGVQGRPLAIGQQSWDGLDYEALKSGILDSRCRAMFT